MQPLSDQALLAVWERGLGQHPIHQALILLSAALPGLSPQDVAELSVGQRDSYLLKLRAQMFGSQLTSLASCQNCSEQIEVNFDVADIQIAAKVSSEKALRVVSEGCEVKFRLPNSLDLLAAAHQTELEVSQSILLKRCVLSLDNDSQTEDPTQLPAPIVQQIVDKMGQADPQADIQLSVVCPACTHTWVVDFDIVTYFWEEINRWAYGALQEVHQLALAYGWSEADILAMTPWKRHFYLQLIYNE